MDQPKTGPGNVLIDDDSSGVKSDDPAPTGIQQPNIKARAAAERMRRYRERRRNGLSCFIAELYDSEIDSLVDRGFLAPAERADVNAVLTALYLFLEQTL